MLSHIGILFLIGASYALYPSSSDVVSLTASNFDRLVEQSNGIWIVEFFAPWCGHCQALVPEYTKAASALKGVVKVGAVNCDEEKSLAGRFGIRGFPTIKIFGSDKSRPIDYNGARTAQGITDEALNIIRNKVRESLSGKKSSQSGYDRGGQDGGLGRDVVELTDDNFESLVYGSKDYWLVEFYAPGCGYCQKLKPEWAEAASNLKGKVKLGAIDATTQHRVTSQFNIQGYPTIKWFEPKSRGSESALDYDGGRTAREIEDWAIERVQRNLPPPEAKQIINKASFKEQCVDNSLCVVAVLPHILDCQSECRNNYLNVLKSNAKNYRSRMWGWVWTEAGSQADLEEKLEIGGFGYPALAALSSKKLKFSLMRGSFSEQGVSEFLRDISFGKGNTQDLRQGKLPSIVDVDAWDGKDGALPESEDIDLSDVDLDEKDEL